MKLMRYILLAVLAVTTVATAAEQKKVRVYNKLTGQWASYPEVTLREIQERTFDSLLVADSLQNTQTSRWNLQTSPYIGDTVVVTALCVVPGKIITFTATGFTMLLYDTTTGAQDIWGSILVRVNAPADTSQIILDGFLNVERGDIIQMTGLVSEFPTNSMNSLTQFQPIAGIGISILGNQPVPPPIPKTISDFYTGLFPGGQVQYSSGEPYEGKIVEFTNVIVDARVNTGRGTFSMQDENGNQITMYDASKFFTLGHGTIVGPPDTSWQRLYPNTNTVIDTIRGFITTVSGSENPRGYRIAPIYYGDIVFGVVLPSITTHRRNPVVVPSDSAARISVRAQAQSGGAALSTVELIYSVDGSPFTSQAMTFDAGDSLYHGEIPQQAANSLVRYFIKATDVNSEEAILANSAISGANRDTSKGFFFYTVLDRPLTIRDVQYTPFVNGRSPYLGASLSLSGIVTADTSQLLFGDTSPWYLQSTGENSWGGIWVVGPDSILGVAHPGDSVTVTGSVNEDFDVTQLRFISSVVVHSTGNPEPPPVTVTTGSFDVGNGTPAAEQYEGMLVQFDNVTVSNVAPVFGVPQEFEITDGSGPVLVRRDGKHSFSNYEPDTAFGKTLLRVNDQIAFVRGILYYSFNRYKVVPRTNADFGTITPTGIDERPVSVLPAQYALSRNYPNPFNPTTRFDVTLPQTAQLEVAIYNVLGQKVATLVNEQKSAGSYTVTWNGRTQAGDLAPSGVYFARMHARPSSGERSGEFVTVQKLIMMK